jgi:ribitol 2-dehydrogenase
VRQDLTGRVALVTGASSGIGRAMARALAAEGMRVALIGRSTDRLNLLADEIGSQAAAIAADLTNADQLENAVAETVARFGPIDVLLPNAGVYISGDVAEGDPDAWDRLIAINVSSVFRLVRAVLPGMIARQSGHIIVTSSVSGHQAFHGEPIYSASKHAIQSFVHGLRRQVAGHNIRVGEVSPGVVLNELWVYTDAASIAAKVEEREGLQSEDVAEAVVFMLTRPPNVTIRDLVILPQNEDV